MNIEEILLILFILILSFDTTNFLQSLISQPLFSCVLIGLLIDQVELSLQIGFIAQMLSLSYIPVGGAKLPDFQIGSNLVLLFFSQGGVSLDRVGQFLPLLILIALLFMFLIELERKFATRQMKDVEYEDVDFTKLISQALVSHLIIYGIGLFIVYYLMLNIDFSFLSIINGKKFYFFMLTFSLAALLLKYFKLGFKK